MGGKKRIVILCEGDTEINAVEYFIRPQWEQDGLKSMGLRAINLSGDIEKVFRLVPKYAIEDYTKAIFTIIDLYGLKRNMYDNSKDEFTVKISKLIEWLKDKFDDKIITKFYPHLAIHETEAWLLADSDVLSKIFSERIRVFTNPENIDFENHPSKIVNNLFLKYKKRNYIKGGLNGDDRKILEKMNLNEIAKKCSYLRSFYDDLKSIGTRSI